MARIKNFVVAHQNVLVAYTSLVYIVCGVLYIQSVLNPGH